MTDLEQKPRLRFKGFTEAWEQRKALYLAEYSKGNGYSKNDLSDSGNPIILYGRLYTKYQFSISDVDTFVIPKKGSVYSRGGEVIVPASGETAEDIARASVVENKGVLLGGDLNVLKPVGYIHPLFLAISISNGKPKIELAKKAQGKSVVHIHNFDIQGLTIAYPSKKEQEQIALFFDRLDSLITLHQRKYEKLKSMKTALLEKMFPAGNDTAPKIRFKGFTEAWEQRKLGDVVERVTRKNENLECTLPLTISAEYGMVDQITFFNNRVASNNLSNYYLLYKGDFAYNKSTSGTAEWGAIKRLDLYESGVLSTLYIVFRPNNINSEYLLRYYETTNWYPEMKKIATEGARNHGLLNIAPMDFFQSELIAPKSTAEQALVGTFFQNLDSLITLHQRKCEKLKNLKKSLLERMFI